MLGQNGPIDPTVGFGQQIKDLQQRIAELERLAGVSVASTWTSLSLLSPNWTQTRTPQYRFNGARVELRGALARISTTYTTGTALFNLPSAITPSQHYTDTATSSIASLTPDRYAYSWIARSTGTFESLATGPDVAPGDSVDLDGISWPI